MDRGDQGRVNAGFLGGPARGGLGRVAPAGRAIRPGQRAPPAGLDGFDQSKSLNTATDRPINLCARLAVGASTGQVGSATATGVALVEINEVP